MFRMCVLCVQVFGQRMDLYCKRLGVNDAFGECVVLCCVFEWPADVLLLILLLWPQMTDKCSFWIGVCLCLIFSGSLHVNSRGVSLSRTNVFDTPVNNVQFLFMSTPKTNPITQVHCNFHTFVS